MMREWRYSASGRGEREQATQGNKPVGHCSAGRRWTALPTSPRGQSSSRHDKITYTPVDRTA